MKPAHKDLEHPPGQIVNPIPKTLGEYVEQIQETFEQEDKSLGQTNYEAYHSQTHQTFMKFENQSPRVQDWWEKASQAVVRQWHTNFMADLRKPTR